MASLFTVISDGMATNPSKGLTSDSTADGGILEPVAFETVQLQTEATPFTTETASTATDATLSSATASPYVTETATAQATTLETNVTAVPFVTELSEAVERNVYTSTDTTIQTVEAFGVAIESASVAADAETTIIYIPPLPRIGLTVDESDASLKHGSDFE